MASVHLLPPIHSMLHRTSGWRTHLFSVAAGSIAVLILAANLLMLPIPYLGIEIHPQTHAVLSVAPGSSGERAGVRIGDMVVRLYDRPIADVFSSLTFVGWIPPRDQPIPIMVERNGQSIMFHLAQDPPVLNSRLFMGAMAVLAILCWITGYVLGVGRSQSVLEAQLAAYFWISIAGVVGTIQFALAASLPLLVMIAWVVAGMLVPLNVYMHVFFPPRMADVVSKQRVKRFVVGMCIITNGFILGVIMVKHSLISVLLALLAVVPVALVIGFSSSAVLLHCAYRTTTVAHTRRQIRLIAAASGIIACA